MSCIVRGARMLDPIAGRDQVANLAFDEGQVTGFVNDHATADKIIDASEHWLMPGIVDLSWRPPGARLDLDPQIRAEAAAASQSGIVTACCPPDMQPIINSHANAELVTEFARRHQDVARLRPIAALTMSDGILSEMQALKNAGCIAVSEGQLATQSTTVLRHALEYAASLDLVVMIRPQESFLAAEGVLHDGPTAARLGIASVPRVAEQIALSRALALIADVGCRAHVMRLSCAQSVDQIRAAKDAGLDVTADVAIAQLFLVEQDVGLFDPRFRASPPYRETADRDALRRAVASGDIDIICSDHHAHSRDNALAPLPQVLPGTPNAPVLLRLALRLVNEGVLSPLQLVRALSSAASQRFGLGGGTLAAGSPADLVLIDPRIITRFDADSYHRAPASPFFHWEFEGAAVKTWRAGRALS